MRLLRSQPIIHFIAIFLLLVMFCHTPISLAQTSSIQATQTQLEQQLKEIENQIAQYEKELANTTTQKNTLLNKINALKTQQKSLQLRIKSTNLQIAALTTKLTTTKNNITSKERRLAELQKQMSNFIWLIKRQDDIPVWYQIISSPTFSAMFNNLADYSQLLGSLENVLQEVTEVKKQLEGQKQVLADQQDEAKNLLSIQVLQQQKLTDSVSQQNTLLQQTKGKESNYQTALKDAKQQATEIRNRIYQLLEVNTQITFGQALQIAQWVSAQTGVRPAFLLGVLTQESSLGKNVGTCNKLGGPPEKSWKKIMKPDRDQEPFVKITSELGRDPDVTPVSCPMRDKNGNQIGWGGAMGPAQFIPSTWMGYRSKIINLTGKNVADPWDIRDAFVAAAIKLKNDGATGGTQGEWNAAMRYFSGSTNPAYRFYGDSVATLTANYQKDIDQLSK